ncbi:helix-turn-helix domain-containing protein [Thiobacillus sp.]|jgi:HTH-type transcriptional regulator/antitoxin HipB|uniref:helix-turn-helix domain-containing protein n=1 Tax=Thiobacillus sp. TaxID=924 RepID=UPI0025D8ECC0|nr:helix-turn-helix domain-containing protein [Thiobacillus sp.]
MIAIMAKRPLVLLTAPQLGQTLLSARKARGMSQAALASRLGLSQPRVSFLEQNAGNLSLGQLLAWCAVLGLELSVGSRIDESAQRTSAGW